MNSLKLRLFRVLLLCAGTGLLVAGCSNDDDSPRELSSKTTLTLSKYYNDKGATTLPTWGRNDQGRTVRRRQSVPEAVYAAPIQPGSQNRSFSSRSARRSTPLRRSSLSGPRTPISAVRTAR